MYKKYISIFSYVFIYFYTLIVTVKVNRLNNLAIDATNNAINNSSLSNIETARELVNSMSESTLKDFLQNKLNDIYDISDLPNIEKKNISSNIDMYIKSQNTLSLSLNTNYIVFNDFNGTEDLETSRAVTMFIDSSLPYEIKANLESPIQNKDKSITVKPNMLSIKESTQKEYKTFSNIDTPLLLCNNTNPANSINSHDIDIKLNGGVSSKADVYKTTIKFEVNQK